MTMPASPDPDRSALIEGLTRSCIRAGRAILDVYATDFAVMGKADKSPVTAADHAAEAILLADLARLAPGVPVVAEEEAAAGRIPDIAERFFLVDPLDGTREFIARNGDFTVNVALIDGETPVLGLVYAPARGLLYGGDIPTGAWRTRIGPDDEVGERKPMRIRPRPAGGLAAVASRSHNTPETDTYLGLFDVAEIVSCGSSLKLCMVAAGEADLYPRLGPTMEWDIAAGDAVLRAAGGMIDGPDGAPMAYRKPGFRNPGFVARGDVTAPPLAAYLPVAR